MKELCKIKGIKPAYSERKLCRELDGMSSPRRRSEPNSQYVYVDKINVVS